MAQPGALYSDQARALLLLSRLRAFWVFDYRCLALCMQIESLYGIPGIWPAPHRNKTAADARLLAANIFACRMKYVQTV